MDRFHNVFGASNWIAFFANRVLKVGKECEDELIPYFILRSHITEMSNGVVGYLLSGSSSHLDLFLDAGRKIGCNEISMFVDAVKNLFHPSPFPCDIEMRRDQLMQFLKGWNGEVEPFPEVEKHRKSFADILQSYVESKMLVSPDRFLNCTAPYDPFEGNKALKKLQRKLKT